jgi:hypothetical protein
LRAEMMPPSRENCADSDAHHRAASFPCATLAHNAIEYGKR